VVRRHVKQGLRKASVQTLTRIHTLLSLGQSATDLKETEKELEHSYANFLCAHYKQSFWWFEVFELFRRFFLVASVTLLTAAGQTPLMQLHVATFISFVGTNVLCWCTPYRMKSDNILALSTHVAQFLVFTLSMMLHFNFVENQLQHALPTLLGVFTFFPTLLAGPLIWADYRTYLQQSGKSMRQEARRVSLQAMSRIGIQPTQSTSQIKGSDRVRVEPQ